MCRHVAGRTLLDIGAAEGWVGRRFAQRDGREVQLLDVIGLNRTNLPFRLYDGRHVPFPDNSFDTALLMLTLHHCDDPEQVLREAGRVARRRVVVTESVYRTPPGRWALWAMDTTVNSWRSRRLMREALHFRTIPQWRTTFQRHGLHLAAEQWISRGLHRHVLFALDP